MRQPQPVHDAGQARHGQQERQQLAAPRGPAADRVTVAAQGQLAQCARIPAEIVESWHSVFIFSPP